jgi:hypothetical protein
MISLRDPVTGDISTNAVLVRHLDLVRPLQKTFDETWERAHERT